MIAFIVLNKGQKEGGEAMHKAERILSIQKLNYVLDNNNKMVFVENFVRDLKKSQRIKDCYIINLQIWVNFFRKRMKEGKFNTDLIAAKLSEANLVARRFKREEWSKIFKIIEEMKNLIPGI